MLTTQQLTTLRTHIDASPDLSSKSNNSDGQVEVAALLNANASPAFTVWKTNVAVGDVGKTFNASELAGLTSLPRQPAWRNGILSGPLETFAGHIKAWLPADLSKRIQY